MKFSIHLFKPLSFRRIGRWIIIFLKTRPINLETHFGNHIDTWPTPESVREGGLIISSVIRLQNQYLWELSRGPNFDENSEKDILLFKGSKIEVPPLIDLDRILK